TEAEYRASAELAAYLSHRYGIPLDRRHIIGHNEVPDPYHPWLRGGVDHHQDPGRHWKWAHYMALIHYYAKHPVTLVHVHRLTIRPATPTLPAVQSGLGNFARTHIAPQPPPTLEHFAPQPKPQRIEQKKRVVAAKPAPKPAPRPSPKPRPRSVVDRTATVHGSALWWSGV